MHSRIILKLTVSKVNMRVRNGFAQDKKGLTKGEKFIVYLINSGLITQDRL